MTNTTEQFLTTMRVLYQSEPTLSQRAQWLIVAGVWFVAVVSIVIAASV